MIALDNGYLLRSSVKTRDVAINAHVGHRDAKQREAKRSEPRRPMTGVQPYGARRAMPRLAWMPFFFRRVPLS